MPSGWEDERLEPVFQLVIGADRQVGLPGSDPDEGDLQLVAQEPQEIEELAARGGVPGQHVVELVHFTDRGSPNMAFDLW
jgi:hypothetical protein